MLDNRDVKDFATPKLGSYFAVPITVASYLHDANQTDDILQNYKDRKETVVQRNVEVAQRAEEKVRREAEPKPYMLAKYLAGCFGCYSVVT